MGSIAEHGKNKMQADWKSLQERKRLNERRRREISEEMRRCTEIMQILLQHLCQETSLSPVCGPLSQGGENKFIEGYMYFM